jgi:hypothetical protein
MTVSSRLDDKAFVAQCDANHDVAEITSLTHQESGAMAPTHVLAVTQLLHKHVERNR